MVSRRGLCWGSSSTRLRSREGRSAKTDLINKVTGRLADANDYLLKDVINQADA